MVLIDGALILTLLGFFFPQIIYLMLVKESEKKSKFWIFFARMLLFVGIIFFVLGWYIFIMY